MKHYFTHLKKIGLALSTTLLSGLLATATAAPAGLSGKTAAELTSMITTGWNLGNTFDANTESGLESETSWGQPYTTREMIRTIRLSGFNAIRIPVTWGHQTFESDRYDYEIEAAWLDRVQEIVDWALEYDLIVIINDHHDCNSSGTWFYYPDSDYEEDNTTFLGDIWKQIAERFADYDQRLIFETMNEPRCLGESYEWWFDLSKPLTIGVVDAIEEINRLNQLIVDIIRENGSEGNLDRMIMCPGYAACYEGIMNDLFKLPTDVTPDRIAVSLHAYRPYDICLGAKSKWLDSYAEEIDNYFTPVYEKFVAKGIPVIIGEESMSYRRNDAARLQWVEAYYGTTKRLGMPCFLWDNNVPLNNGGETHGHFDRINLTWYHQDFIDKIMDVMGIDVKVDNHLADHFSIYPNPAQNFFHISSQYEIKSAVLYSVMGKEVMSIQTSGNELDVNVSALPSGVYMLRLDTEAGTVMAKVMLK